MAVVDATESAPVEDAEVTTVFVLDSGLGAETPIIEADTGPRVTYDEPDGTTIVTPTAVVVVYRGPALVCRGTEEVVRWEAPAVTVVPSVVAP